jgi:predicted kinase
MKLTIINGSSCAGKSTVVKAILKEKEHLFHLSYDSLKWSFSRYSPEKHSDNVHVLFFAVAETMIEMGYDVICDSTIFKKWRERLIEFATARRYEIVEVNLEAEYKTLLERFNARVARAKANPEMRITNTSEERFRTLYDTYQTEKNTAALTFWTDREQPIEEIEESILKLL